jgi:hypothetical protein
MDLVKETRGSMQGVIYVYIRGEREPEKNHPERRSRYHRCSWVLLLVATTAKSIRRGVSSLQGDIYQCQRYHRLMAYNHVRQVGT